MNINDKDLAAFAEYLFSFMSEDTPATPLTHDEVVAILQNYGPPEPFSHEEKEDIIKRMIAAHGRRKRDVQKVPKSPSMRSAASS